MQLADTLSFNGPASVRMKRYNWRSSACRGRSLTEWTPTAKNDPNGQQQTPATKPQIPSCWRKPIILGGKFTILCSFHSDRIRSLFSRAQTYILSMGLPFLARHWLGPASVSLWNIWTMDKESLRILYQTTEHIWTKNAIQNLIFLSLIAPPRSPLAWRRYTGHNSSKEMFCKSSMPHTGSLTCTEKNVYFHCFFRGQIHGNGKQGMETRVSSVIILTSNDIPGTFEISLHLGTAGL